jgi:hypothetical protein
MRDQYSLTVRIISTIVLSFFIWSFGGVFDIAYAIENSRESRVSSQKSQNNIQSTASQQTKKENRPEEKFGRDMGDIENILKDDKSDYETKKSKIKSKRVEIDADDVEIKKQFKDTEDKIKGLPEIIKKRHRDFVKKYDDNLQTLRTNLDDIDKAKINNEKDLAQKKAKDFLSKVKPHQKQALDPENLPNSTPELKEYQKIDKKQSKKTELSDFMSEQILGMTLDKPILVAANGSLSGLLNGSGSGVKLSKISAPTSADLAESIEVQLTPEIRAKAQELRNNPVKIYEFVRNSIDYEPYYGSLKGAQQTLAELAGNDFDQASLLIALLRAANISARYVYGTIELPLDRIMNWLGGFTNPNAATQFLATNGIPGTLITEGGVIKYAQFEHAWVEAYVDMLPSMGAVNRQGKYWTPIDPSMKNTIVSQSIDISKSVPFDEMAYITSDDDMPPVLSYIYKVKDYYNTNYDYDFTKVFHVAVKDRKEFGIFMGTLPYQVINSQRYSEAPDAKRHKIGLSLSSDGVSAVSIQKTLPEIAGKKLTVSYSAATTSDHAVITNYGGLLKTPAYLVNVKPEIRLNDAVILTGPAIGLGGALSLTTQLDSPNMNTYIKTTDITYGISYAIGLPALHYSGSQLVGQINKMRALQGTLYDSVDAMDTRAGELLQNIAIEYFGQLNNTSKSIEAIMHVRLTKMPSIALVSADATYDNMFGMPVSAPIMKGLGIDAIRVVSSHMPIDGDMAKRKEFIKHRGLNSSYLEHKILENLLSVASISAVKALQIAAKNGVPIYTINSGNISSILPMLTLSDGDKADIQNAVNAGKEVIVSRDNVTLYDWTGVGYIARDPNTGTGAYMISNELGGGGTAQVSASNAAFDAEQKIAWFVAGQAMGTLLWDYLAGVTTEIIALPLWGWFGYTPAIAFEANKDQVITAVNNDQPWIFYYSGHGPDDNSYYDYLSPGGVNVNDKNTDVQPSQIQADAKIVFLNACNSAKFGSFVKPFGIDGSHNGVDRREIMIGWKASHSALTMDNFALQFWLEMGIRQSQAGRISYTTVGEAIQRIKQTDPGGLWFSGSDIVLRSDDSNGIGATLVP